ncbi:T-cell-specific surface glycoprotein CD28 Precursor [Channa argus]|uniref:T-cell-specific surface glycoprotein CD28 n=2 Tax=Channa argus TaxID=215402 RepID=A0A6G1PVZ2_CHAAH|nr:T-cell-specific surface glycoprotein CD28 Precursor [Channa argus]
MTAWLLWMVLACLSDGAVAKCSVESVNEGSDFRKVSCPPLMPGPQQLKYLLLFNDSRVAQMQIEMPDSAGGQLSANFDVTASRDGLYVCKMEVTYPPPFKEDCHSFQVKVNRTEKQHVVAISSINSTTPPTTTPTCPGRSSFIPEVVLYAACGVLLVYSLAVTCITIITWRKMKENKEDTCVYMNTRPADPRKNYRV